MSFELLIQKEAWIEIQLAYDWYEEQKQGLGDDFLIEVEKCYNYLIENPRRYSHLYRRIKTERFPYLIIYEIEEERIIVMRVRHVKQKPL
jgi:plasmid stabilization system protein ParE